MKAKIVVDSCCDLSKELRDRFNIETVPLKIDVNGKSLLDDENLSIQELIENMKADADAPKTASPSPDFFVEKFKGEESVFVVTLSDKLSSTYQNAILAKKFFIDEIEDKFIHIFNSFSASAGETLISYKIGELIEAEIEESVIVEKIASYIDEMKTMFVLESLDNLVKAGRMTKLKGKIASILNIKPIMGATEEGTITLLDKARGTRRALKKMIEMIGEQGVNLEEKILSIAHCNAPERAEMVKAEASKNYNFKEIIIVETAGISTVYANEGGIIIAF